MKGVRAPGSPARLPGSGVAAAPVDEARRGTAYALLAYGLWGMFPLYFHALKPAGAWEILAHRIVWTLVFCGLVLLVQRDLGWIRPTWANRRLALGLVAAAFLIAVNWVIYIYAVVTARTYEAALGYFLNPILTVALGVIVLRERVRILQWIAVGVGALAAVYLSVAGGSLPWISLSLAVSFGLYGLTKKRIGVSLNAMRSLAAETAVLAPVAVLTLGLLEWRHGTTLVGYGAGHTTLLLLAGVVTAIPLLLFAEAARRVPLVTIGLIQFSTPLFQLLIGVLVLGEHVSPQLWVGFGIVWLALTLLTIDSLGAARRSRRARHAAADALDCPEPV